MRRAALLYAAVSIAIAVVLVVVLSGDSPPGATPDDAPVAASAPSGTSAPKPRAASTPRRGAAIAGVVLDADAPAPDVAVECVRVDDDPSPGTRRPAAWLEVFSSAARSPAAAWRGTTDASGAFRVAALARGVWRVTARSADGRAAAESVTVEGRADSQVTIRLPARGFVLRGRVERADGSAVAARVAVQPVTDRGFAPDEFPRLAWSDAAPDGTFALAGIAAARVNLVAAAGTDVISVGPVSLPREELLVVRFGEGVTRRRGLARDAETKAPVAGARISWIAWGDGEHRMVGTRAVSGADGGFELPGLAQGRAYVEADGFATEHVWDHGGTDEIVVELARLAAIGGRVVTADGAAAEGAIVHAFGRRASGLDPVVRSTSDANGAFRLDDAAPGDAFVFVHGGGWTSVGLGAARDDGPNAFFVNAGARDRLVLRVEPSARVTGRVVDAAGAAVPGARVTTWSRAFGHARSAAPFPETVCDGDGRFVLADLIAGAAYQFRAKADGWADVYAEHVAGTPGELELRLLDSWFVDVHVVAEEDGHPIAGAKVRGEVHELVDVRGFGDEATTDADGRARVGPGPRGEFGVRVDAPDRLRREEPWWVETVQRGDAASAEVRVPKGLTISGRVEVPEGAPRNRVRIMAGEVATDRGIDDLWTDPPDFRLDRLAPGPHIVGAQLAGSDGRQWSGVVRADAGASGVVIALTEEPRERSEPQHELALRLLDADGAPVFAADVWVHCRTGAKAATSVARTTAAVTTTGGEVADGVLTVRVPDDVEAADVEVHRARDRQDRPLPCEMTRVAMPDPSAAEFVVRLPRPRTIEGRVAGPDGRGVEGVCIRAGYPRSGQAAATWSGPDGRFRLESLGDGQFWVKADVPPGWREAAVVFADAGATDVAIVVETKAPVRIVVVDADGAPLADARVIVNLPAATHDGRSGSDGTFVVPDVLAGAAGGLSIVPPESRPDLFPLTLPKWTPQDATIRLERAAVVAGTLRDQTGRPLAGVKVFCKVDGVPTWPPGRTDEAGRFVVGRLRPGSPVRMWVEFIENDPAVEVGEAMAGGADLALVFDVGISVRVRVANARRNEIEGGVRALLADGSERWARFGQDGTAILANLPPGAVLRLRFGPTGEGRWAAADGVVAGDRDVELTLRDGATIAGRVEFPDGFQGDVEGTAERDGFRVELEFSRFRATGLPPGRWRLRFAGKSRRGEEYEGTADVEAGDLDAVVRLVRKP